MLESTFLCFSILGFRKDLYCLVLQRYNHARHVLKHFPKNFNYKTLVFHLKPVSAVLCSFCVQVPIFVLFFCSRAHLKAFFAYFSPKNKF